MNINGMNLAIEQITGSKNVLISDDLGIPSMMVRIPKFNLSDVIPGGPDTPHPMFIVNGKVKDCIYIGKYLACVDNDRAYSLPGREPLSFVTYDDARKMCYNKGPGWHMMTNMERVGIGMMCRANGTYPIGNTDNGVAFGNRHYAGVPVASKGTIHKKGVPTTFANGKHVYDVANAGSIKISSQMGPGLQKAAGTKGVNQKYEWLMKQDVLKDISEIEVVSPEHRNCIKTPRELPIRSEYNGSNLNYMYGPSIVDMGDGNYRVYATVYDGVKFFWAYCMTRNFRDFSRPICVVDCLEQPVYRDNYMQNHADVIMIDGTITLFYAKEKSVLRWTEETGFVPFFTDNAYDEIVSVSVEYISGRYHMRYLARRGNNRIAIYRNSTNGNDWSEPIDICPEGLPKDGFVGYIHDYIKSQQFDGQKIIIIGGRANNTVGHDDARFLYANRPNEGGTLTWNTWYYFPHTCQVKYNAAWDQCGCAIATNGFFILGGTGYGNGQNVYKKLHSSTVDMSETVTLDRKTNLTSTVLCTLREYKKTWLFTKESDGSIAVQSSSDSGKTFSEKTICQIPNSASINSFSVLKNDIGKYHMLAVLNNGTLVTGTSSDKISWTSESVNIGVTGLTKVAVLYTRDKKYIRAFTTTDNRIMITSPSVNLTTGENSTMATVSNVTGSSKIIDVSMYDDGEKIGIIFGTNRNFGRELYRALSYDNGATWTSPILFKWYTQMGTYRNYEPSNGGSGGTENISSSYNEIDKAVELYFNNPAVPNIIWTARSLNLVKPSTMDMVYSHAPKWAGEDTAMTQYFPHCIIKESGIYRSWWASCMISPPAGIKDYEKTSYCESRDGINWSVPVRCTFEQLPDFKVDTFLYPSVIKEDDGSYIGYVTGQNKPSCACYFMRYETRDGVHFTNPKRLSIFNMFTDYAYQCVIKHQGVYHIWLSKPNTGTLIHGTSNDGITFENIKQCVVYSKDPSISNNSIDYDTNVFIHDGRFYITGKNSSDARSIAGCSNDGVNWCIYLLFTRQSYPSSSFDKSWEMTTRGAFILPNNNGLHDMYITFLLPLRGNLALVMHTYIRSFFQADYRDIKGEFPAEQWFLPSQTTSSQVQHQLVSDPYGNTYVYYIDGLNNLIRATPNKDPLSENYFKDLTSIVTCKIPTILQGGIRTRIVSYHIFRIEKTYHLYAVAYGDGAVVKTKLYHFTSGDGVLYDDFYDDVKVFPEKEFISVNGCELHDADTGKVNGYRLYVHQNVDGAPKVFYSDSVDGINLGEKVETQWTYSSELCKTYPSSPEYVQRDGVIHEYTPMNNSTTGASIALHTSVTGERFGRMQSIDDEIFREKGVVYNGYTTLGMKDGRHAHLFSTTTGARAVITDGTSTLPRMKFQHKNKKMDLVLYPSRPSYVNTLSLAYLTITRDPNKLNVYYAATSGANDMAGSDGDGTRDLNVYLLKSRDLVHWDYVDIIYTRSSYSAIVFSPSIVFFGGKWFMYYNDSVKINRIDLGADIDHPNKNSIVEPCTRMEGGYCYFQSYVREKSGALGVYYTKHVSPDKQSLIYESSVDGVSFKNPVTVIQKDGLFTGTPLGPSMPVWTCAQIGEDEVLLIENFSHMSDSFRTANAVIGKQPKESDWMQYKATLLGSLDLIHYAIIVVPYKEGYAIIRNEGMKPEDQVVANKWFYSPVISFTKNFRDYYADYESIDLFSGTKTTIEPDIDFGAANAWNNEIAITAESTIPLYQVGKQIVFNKMQRSQFFRVLNAKRLIIEAKYVDDKNKPFTVLGQVSITKKTTNWQIDVNETSGIVVRNENGEVLLSVNNTGYSTNVDLSDVDRITNDHSFINEGETADVQVRILIKEVYNAEGVVKTLTGTCGTSHDGTVDGIMDLCGNVWEYAAGLKLKTNRILVAKNNNAASWWFGDEKLVAISTKDFNSYAGQDDDKTAALVKSTDGKPKLAIRSNQADMEYFDKTPVKQIDLSDTADRVNFNMASVIGLNLGMYTDGNIEETIATVNNIDTEKLSDKRIATFGGDMSSKITKGGILSTFFAHEESMCQYGVGFRVCYYDPD